MKYCSKCGKEINEEAVVCIHCGCRVESAPYQEEDKKSPGFGVLGFFFPLIGLILYCVWKDKTPLKAKSAGKGALIGFILEVVAVIIYMVAVFALIGTAL
ncbi:MAG: zinc ribbon domain-containing protein [Clostridia bacterium]|nr:zinc ribbon domain-containing protein [Clostridia bacterium]